MMRYVFALLTLFLCQFTWADVAALTAFPTKRVEVNSGVGCRIAMTLPADSFVPGGVSVAFSRGVTVGDPLPKSWKANLNELYFSLSCKSSNDSDARGGTYPIAYNSIKNEWQKDASAWEKEANGFADKFDRKALLELIRVTNVNNVRAVNSQGWVMTQEDTIGDERWRKRTMSFCLLHPPKAICGVGVVSMLSDGPKGDLTQHALKIIQSIEFLPDASPEGVPAPTRNSELQK